MVCVVWVYFKIVVRNVAKNNLIFFIDERSDKIILTVIYLSHHLNMFADMENASDSESSYYSDAPSIESEASSLDSGCLVWTTKKCQLLKKKILIIFLLKKVLLYPLSKEK